MSAQKVSTSNSDNDTIEQPQWYALRDLKRSNAREPAYKVLSSEGIRVYTPLTIKNSVVGGRRVCREVPALSDLLFAHSTRSELDPLIDSISTLQYRYRLGAYCEPITVPSNQMELFISAVGQSGGKASYYRPDEVTTAMVGHRVRIIGGPLEGHEVQLQRLRGTRRRRFWVTIPGYIAASVEIDPEYLVLID